jgi:hypothetical protein
MSERTRWRGVAAATVRWVEPVIPLAPAAPVHPNARGLEGMAGAVTGAVADRGS